MLNCGGGSKLSNKAAGVCCTDSLRSVLKVPARTLPKACVAAAACPPTRTSSGGRCFAVCVRPCRHTVLSVTGSSVGFCACHELCAALTSCPAGAAPSRWGDCVRLRLLSAPANFGRGAAADSLGAGYSCCLRCASGDCWATTCIAKRHGTTRINHRHGRRAPDIVLWLLLHLPSEAPSKPTTW